MPSFLLSYPSCCEIQLRYNVVMYTCVLQTWLPGAIFLLDRTVFGQTHCQERDQKTWLCSTSACSQYRVSQGGYPPKLILCLCRQINEYNDYLGYQLVGILIQLIQCFQATPAVVMGVSKTGLQDNLVSEAQVLLAADADSIIRSDGSYLMRWWYACHERDDTDGRYMTEVQAISKR